MSYTFAAIDEGHLAPEDVVALRAALEDARTFRREQLAGLAEIWPSHGNLPPDQHTVAREEVLTTLATAARAVLVEVDAALSRIDTGHYGSCHLCDQPIPVRRLRILPHARYCGPCHQLREAVT
ncbi:TraR/DksA family transcriptional regulator [Kribbella catacumbae]|uniref:TraR/DksA family transcriptional regulator n=1 Tax=Kribbella catacumbae TaxID=460086 RepID=UPI0005901E8E|nr:TraR/DksA C4-type zinc finger protein [Kribbella catacumbae]